VLKYETVVITGGAGLLGKCFTKALLDNQATVVIADIDTEKAYQFKKTLPSKSYNNCHVYPLDITNRGNINELINTVNNTVSPITALVNNAYPRNGNYGRHFFDVTYEDFCENVSMNLGGYFLCAQQFAQHFINAGVGKIINICSIYGCISPKFEIYEETNMTTPVEYAAIKSAIIHLTKYMAKYLKGKNITVNSISPGGILDNQENSFIKNYNMHCLNKGMLSPEDIQSALLFLLDKNSKYINGQNIIVDDGFTI